MRADCIVMVQFLLGYLVQGENDLLFGHREWLVTVITTYLHKSLLYIVYSKYTVENRLLPFRRIKPIIIAAMPDFYTGKGDQGYTGILGKGRLPKHQARLETIGTIDEASAALAVARASCQVEKIVKIIITMQRDFSSIMSEIAASPENAAKLPSIDRSKVAWLEEQIEEIGSQVEMPAEFILPGDTLCGANLSLARTIIRRAERHVVRLVHQHKLENREILRYFNRASSLLFVLELYEYKMAGKKTLSLASKKK
jgi:cob(I)alamin adenosyltransferase